MGYDTEARMTLLDGITRCAQSLSTEFVENMRRRLARMGANLVLPEDPGEAVRVLLAAVDEGTIDPIADDEIEGYVIGRDRAVAFIDVTIDGFSERVEVDVVTGTVGRL